MQKKGIYREIVRLTINQEWIDNPKIVEQVQALGKELSSNRREPINYLAIGGIETKYPDGSTKIYHSLEQCCISENLSKGTIQKSIRLKYKLADGRSFRLLDNS